MRKFIWKFPQEFSIEISTFFSYFFSLLFFPTFFAYFFSLLFFPTFFSYFFFLLLFPTFFPTFSSTFYPICHKTLSCVIIAMNVKNSIRIFLWKYMRKSREKMWLIMSDTFLLSISHLEEILFYNS